MDHLPTPRNAVTNKRAIVPYVCLKIYDGGPFLTYPIRECVSHALPPDGKIPGGSPYWRQERRYPTPKPEQEDFLQRWLFFGLIHEILGDCYRPEDLICTIETDEGKTSIVSTSGLVETLDKWIADIHSGCVNPRQTYEHIAECLRLAFATIHGAGPDFDPRVKLSLASLGELFALATNEAYHAREDKCPAVFMFLVNDSYWQSPMLSSGWCPSQIKVNVDNRLKLQTLHFLTILGQPASDGLHWRCNNDRCLAYQNELASYQTKHVTDCNCEHFSIDMKRLTEILENGSLPLLRIQRGHTLSELSVELVPSQSTSCYIAISHVWADGLGNPYKNSLPRCQLDFLHKTINEYYANLDPQAVEEILLWCDTLCCPVEPGKAKNTALAYMKRTYLEATRVLVLDASLRMYDFNTMDADEACIRILNSGWTRRLWTLQEGALPAKTSRLSILFKDGAINIHHLLQRMFQIVRSSIGLKGLASDIINGIGKFAKFPYEYDGDRREDLGTVEAGLLHRSVSVPSDEPLLIANLLDLDIADILNGSCPLASCANAGCDHSRIHRMWLLMPTASRGIPRNILLRAGPRLSEPGFRWAPSTLLYNEIQNLPLCPRTSVKNEDSPTASDPMLYPQSTMGLVIDHTSQGVPTSRGLLVRFTGYSLSMAPGVTSNPWNVVKQGGSLYSRSIDGTWYQIDRRHPAEQDPFLSTKLFRTIVQEEGNLWIIHDSAFTNHEMVAEAKGAQPVMIGLLVQLLSDEEGIKYVQSKLHIYIALLRTSMQKLFEAAYESAKQVTRHIPTSHGEENEVTNLNSSMLEHEIHRVAIQNASQDVTAIAAALSSNAIILFQELIAIMVVGGYGCLGPRTADEQQWCCD